MISFPLLIVFYISCDSCMMNSCLYQQKGKSPSSIKRGFSLRIGCQCLINDRTRQPSNDIELEDCRILSSIKNIGMADIVQQSKIYFMLKPYNFIFPQMFINNVNSVSRNTASWRRVKLHELCISMSRGFSLNFKNSFIQVTETNQSNIICNVDNEFCNVSEVFFSSGSIIFLLLFKIGGHYSTIKT